MCGMLCIALADIVQGARPPAYSAYMCLVGSIRCTWVKFLARDMHNLSEFSVTR
jgi:hypothetical protein